MSVEIIARSLGLVFWMLLDQLFSYLHKNVCLHRWEEIAAKNAR